MHEFSNTLIYTEPNFKLNLCSIVAAFLWKGKRNKMTGKTRKGEREKEGKELWIYKVSNCNLTITESRIQLNCCSAVICKILIKIVTRFYFCPWFPQWNTSPFVSNFEFLPLCLVIVLPLKPYLEKPLKPILTCRLPKWSRFHWGNALELQI